MMRRVSIPDRGVYNNGTLPSKEKLFFPPTPSPPSPFDFTAFPDRRVAEACKNACHRTRHGRAYRHGGRDDALRCVSCLHELLLGTRADCFNSCAHSGMSLVMFGFSVWVLVSRRALPMFNRLLVTSALLCVGATAVRSHYPCDSNASPNMRVINTALLCRCISPNSRIQDLSRRPWWPGGLPHRTL